MNETLFELYCSTKRMIKKAQESDIGGAESREIVREWEQVIETLDNISPDYSNRYKRLVKNQESLTPEQIDFICYQIGDWYLMMKPLLEGSHDLGHMKERLKKMICGE